MKSIILSSLVCAIFPLSLLAQSNRVSIERGHDAAENTHGTVLLSDGRTLTFGKQIGQGGNGWVYEGTLDGEKVAVKQSFFQFTEPSGDVDKLELLKSKGFRRIPAIKAYFDLDGANVSRFIVYEFLHAFVYDNTSFVSMTRGLAELHATTTHDDIKPYNMMQKESGEQVFIDFDSKGFGGSPFWQNHTLTTPKGLDKFDRAYNDVIALGRSLLALKHHELIRGQVLEISPKAGRQDLRGLKEVSKLSDEAFWDYLRSLVPNLDNEDKLMISMARGRFKTAHAVLEALNRKNEL